MAYGAEAEEQKGIEALAGVFRRISRPPERDCLVYGI